MAHPSLDENDDVLLGCRYGDLDDVRDYISRFGVSHLAAIRDDNGNSILHMLCANGHTELLEYLLPILPTSLLSVQNASGSTALHWAALNSHLSIVQKLVEFPDGPGVDLIDIKNKAGRSPLAEAENVGWDEGAKWLVQVMNLDEGPTEQEGDADAAVDPSQQIEVEIEDADGKVAKMTIQSPPSEAPPPEKETAVS
ncbi:ankyrin repeat-containing domain protein [Flagelloscypha sp. PMI_526]|nr:ankyrin repeat-containing domain protein [Flagelloscypha sp. PMI_526]